MGDARGRWEGDTLVVETTNFTDKTSFSGLHSDQLKLTEWFTRIDPADDRLPHSASRIRTTWTAPFTVRLTITQQPGYQLYEYSCHEGNGAVGYALSGERAYEQMVADAKAKGLPIPPRTMGMEVYSGAPVEGRQPVARVRRRGNNRWLWTDRCADRGLSLPQVRRHLGAAPAAAVLRESHVALKCLECAHVLRVPRHVLDGASARFDSTSSLE